MNYKLWNICNDLDISASNQEATLDAFGYIMDGMDKAAADATRGGQEAAAAFVSQYENYSRMLFVLLGVMEDQRKEAKGLIDKAFAVVKGAEE